MSVFVELLYTTSAVVRAIFLSAVQALVGALQKDVRGEIVLITGSGSGLGRLLAVAFARRGAVVVGWDVNEHANEETADIVRATGGLIHVYTCDVSSPDEVKEVARRLQAEVGDVDILVNNAGIVSGKQLLDVTDDIITKTIRVNLLAQIWASSPTDIGLPEQDLVGYFVVAHCIPCQSKTTSSVNQ
ncbi:Epidermal retinol dehydrogenase 2 [Lamellibrachia satsuma]|nr:Epidermal retinol dehydrogenase 2 [Lamellibrachia satsuma]